MSLIDRAERLKTELTDKWVVVSATSPELKRFASLTGTVPHSQYELSRSWWSSTTASTLAGTTLTRLSDGRRRTSPESRSLRKKPKAGRQQLLLRRPLPAAGALVAGLRLDKIRAAGG
ncbi:MAG UNVERIFIED_CONTAM: hypothetical protein LVR18_48210 [Planctomycetaceae bacterium]